MFCKHYMVRSAAANSVVVDTITLGEALAKMIKHHMQELLIINEQDEFVGEMTTFTLAKMLLPEGADGNFTVESAEIETVTDIDDRITPHLNRKVREFAEHDLPTMRPDTPLMEAVLLLAGGRLRLPVVDPKTNKMVGVISPLTVLRRYQF